MIEAHISDSSLLIVGGQRRPEWTVKEYAAEWGVTERTVYTWINKNALLTRRTPGGRVRILGTIVK